VDRLTRKELKTDKFALEVEHGVEYVQEHKQQVLRYSLIALVVIVLGVGIYFFRQHQNAVREDALREALSLQDAVVNQPASEGRKSFPTEDAKSQALKKALTEVAGKHSGTDQGEVAQYYIGTIDADKGDIASAEKSFKQVADSGNANYASLAKLALAPIYKSQGKTADGEKVLRSIVDHPTLFVSKEEATIVLAQYMQSYNPVEARKLLEPLRTDRSTISRAALAALAEIPQK
jgi:predicted negative regulator of RcsB-dependent stress response